MQCAPVLALALEISMPFLLRLAGCAALLAAMGSTACAPIKSHQGYVIDKANWSISVQPGVDNRESVLNIAARAPDADQPVQPGRMVLCVRVTAGTWLQRS